MLQGSNVESSSAKTGDSYTKSFNIKVSNIYNFVKYKISVLIFV